MTGIPAVWDQHKAAVQEEAERGKGKEKPDL